MTLFHPKAEREYLAANDYYLAVGNRIAARFADAARYGIRPFFGFSLQPLRHSFTAHRLFFVSIRVHSRLIN